MPFLIKEPLESPYSNMSASPTNMGSVMPMSVPQVTNLHGITNLNMSMNMNSTHTIPVTISSPILTTANISAIRKRISDKSPISLTGGEFSNKHHFCLNIFIDFIYILLSWKYGNSTRPQIWTLAFVII